MADYPSKHSGKTIDDAVDTAVKISQSELDFLDFVANSNNKGIYYRDADNVLKVLKLSSSPISSNGSIYVENGTVKIGTLPAQHIAGEPSKKVKPTSVYDLNTQAIATSKGASAVQDFDIHAVVCGKVTQIRVEFKMPDNAKTLEGNFSDICIAKLNKKSTLFDALGITANNLVPLCNGLLHTGGTHMVFGYISMSTGNIFITRAGTSLKAGHKVSMGTTFISA